MARHDCRSAGFSYILLMLLLGVMGILGSFSIDAGSRMNRRGAEVELLRIGEEFDSALRSYRENSVNISSAASTRGPAELVNLTRDTRSGRLVRHVRKIYADPLIGQENWGIIRDQEGFILGIYSLAEGEPIKQEGFLPTQEAFRRAKSYRGWVFGEDSLQR